MKLSKIFALLLALCLISSAACAATFTDAHGNVIELDDSLEAYAAVTLVGADNAARQGETNLGDLWRTRCAGSPFPAKSTRPLMRTT